MSWRSSAPKLRPITLATLAFVLLGSVSALGHEGDTGDQSERITITLDIYEDLPGSSWSPRGRITSSVQGGERGGQSATSDELDSGFAARAARSLEDLGAERTPDGLVVTLPETVLFEFDSAELVGDADQVVNRVAELLTYYSEIEVEVRGHTDSVGSDSYNQELSQARADTVRDALIDSGASGSQLEAIGFGSTQPVAPNEKPNGEDNPQGREQNRRVEIVLKDS